MGLSIWSPASKRGSSTSGRTFDKFGHESYVAIISLSGSKTTTSLISLHKTIEGTLVILFPSLSVNRNPDKSRQYFLKNEGFRKKMPLLKVPKNEMVSSSRNPKSFEIIKLNVGGTVFKTLRGPLENTDSLLKKMIEHTDDCTANVTSFYWYVKITTKEYFIDRDGTHFRYILNYLRCVADEERLASKPEEAKQVQEEEAVLPMLAAMCLIKDEEKSQLLEEARFYNLTGLVDILEEDKTKKE